jgi:hypothetical protein
MLFTGIGALLILTIAGYFLRQKHRWSGDYKKDSQLRGYLYLEKRVKQGKNGPMYTKTTFVGVTSKSNAAFMVTKEKTSDRLLKNFGISSEFQTGDHNFYHKYYIACDNNQINRTLAQNPNARSAIQELFENNDITCLIHSKGKLWIEHNLEVSIDNLEKIVESLYCLLPIFDNIHISLSNKIFDINNFKASLLMGFHSAAMLVGVAGLVGPVTFDILDWWKLLKIVALCGILVCIVWFVLITLVMNKSSRVNLVLADFAIVGIAGIFLLSNAAIFDYNIEYDDSIAEIHQQRINDKTTYRCGKKGRSTCYKIYIQDWEKPQESIRFEVNRSEYSQAIVGQYVTLDVRKGKLGVRWIKSRTY